MMQKMTLIGNLGMDPEVRYTGQGTPVCNMRVATNEIWYDKQGKKQEHTEWHRIVVWGKNAENCGQYLSKGRLVHIEGRLRTRKWLDKDKNQRFTTEVIADRVIFLPTGKRNEQAQETQAVEDDAQVTEPVLEGEAQEVFAGDVGDADIPF